MLAEARTRLPVLPEITRALDDLAQLAAQAKGAEVAIDLGDLRGYAYHSGAMFSAYIDGVPNAIARGGRMTTSARRPAAPVRYGLRSTCGAARISPVEARGTAILAWAQDDALSAAVAAAMGEVVIQALPATIMCSTSSRATVRSSSATAHGWSNPDKQAFAGRASACISLKRNGKFGIAREHR